MTDTTPTAPAKAAKAGSAPAAITADGLRGTAAQLRTEADYHRGEAKRLSQAAAAVTMAATALEGGRK